MATNDSTADIDAPGTESAASSASAKPRKGKAKVKQTREQSTIQFPYGDLSDGIEVAQAIMKGGGVACDVDQLAGLMAQSPSSGNFRMKVTTARMFGLVDFSQSKYQLTELGFRAIDSHLPTQRAGKADAFLKVPLYLRVYEEFKGKQLPPRPAALEHAFVGFGVSSKQKDRARQAFDRSAEQAGYFEMGGRDRLVRPTVAGAKAADLPPNDRTEREDPKTSHGGGGGTGNGGGGLHPFIQGLLQTLPEPGTLWTIEGRAAWLQAAAMNFTLIYKGEGKIDIQVSPQKSSTTG